MSKINLVKFDNDDNNENNSSEQLNNDMLLNVNNLNEENDLSSKKRKNKVNIPHFKSNNKNNNNDYVQKQRVNIQEFKSENTKPRKKRNKNTKNANMRKKRKKKSNFFKFLISFLITLFVCIILLTGVGIFYAYDVVFKSDDPYIDMFDNDNAKYDTDNNTSLFGGKDRYNFAFFGIDDQSEIDARTDFMMIGSYDTVNNVVKMMSIPRDTLAVMPEDRIEFLKEHDVPILFPDSGEMKLNEVNHFATDEYGCSFLLAQMEEMFGVDFDFYVKFDLAGFRYLVDAIGGVPFYVPQRMYYNDPTQDLYVDLQKGYQVLNGKQAEGVVRYRKADPVNPISEGYATGDLGRIEVQQDFILAFIEQLTSLSNLTTTLPAILETGYQYCETNFDLTDLPAFMPFLTDFDPNNIEFYTMPNELDGSYVVPLEPDTSELIDEIFYADNAPVDPVSSVGLDIQVLNATYTSGIATYATQILEDNGFSVSYCGDYVGDKQQQTKIYVKDKAYGQDLAQYFDSPKYVTDPTIEPDIQIIIGIDQTQ